MRPMSHRARSRSRSISGGFNADHQLAGQRLPSKAVRSRNQGIAGEIGHLNGAHSKTMSTRPCEMAVTSARLLESQKKARPSVNTEQMVKRLSFPIVKKYRDR